MSGGANLVEAEVEDKLRRAPVCLEVGAIHLISLVVELAADKQERPAGRPDITQVDWFAFIIGSEDEVVDVVFQLGWKCLEGILRHWCIMSQNVQGRCVVCPF